MAIKTIGDISQEQIQQIKDTIENMKDDLTVNWPDIGSVAIPQEVEDAFEILRSNQLKLTKGIEIVIRDLYKLASNS